MTREPTSPEERRVPAKICMGVISRISAGELSMEEAMRLLYPEEAEKIYQADLWPFGPPKN
jgi:hypothetical protein